MDKTRIYGRAIEIDSEEVKEFYNKRAVALKDSLSTVNLQNSEQAKIRDSYEKERIIPKLELKPSDKVIELGCGFGRFAEAFVSKVGCYKGIDISSELIKIANAKFKSATNFFFTEGSVGTIAQETNYYNVLMAMGVLMYLNDSDVAKLVRSYSKIAADSNARIYIRESVALIPERLTLNGFWSDNLQSKYTAIYRTIPEYESLFQAFIDSGFQLKEKGIAYPPIQNNAETTQFYFIFAR